MLTAGELRAFLQANGLRLTKRLGQHYLVDWRMIERVVDACDLSLKDTVVEIGAGLGALTEPLAQRAGRVIAIEVDRRIAALLAKRMAGLRQVTVVHEDILRFTWNRLTSITVVGAIPYRLTSPILLALFEHRHAMRQTVLVMQQEVAERLLARPGTKAYGRLSVLAQYGWQITSVCAIGAGAFFPPPDVHSTCVRLIPHAHAPIAVEDESRFFEVVRAAFSHRRKTLVNCLHDHGVRREAAIAALQSLGLPTDVRGETLNLAQFAVLANVLRGNRN